MRVLRIIRSVCTEIDILDERGIQLERYMHKSILVPFIDSQSAERILPHVKQLADHFETRIMLAQFVEPHIEFSRSQIAHQDQAIEEKKRQSDIAGDYLSSLKDQLKTEGVHALTLVLHGGSVKTILRTTQGWNADLIAMAIQVVLDWNEYFMDVAAWVVYQVDHPLFPIRSRGDL